MVEIKILDLFCGAGGCSVGYYQAAAELSIKVKITGVDNRPQPNYPFKFVQMDALKYLRLHGHRFDVVHASPPCQHYSKSTAGHKNKGKEYPDMVPVVRAELTRINKPFIIENVSKTAVRPDVELVGYMFGLRVIRRRIFELHNIFMLQPGIPKKPGEIANGDYVSVYGNASWKNTGNVLSGSRKLVIPPWRKETVVKTWAYAMGIDWMKKDKELSQAIPPAYTHFIGMNVFPQLINS